MKLNWKQLVKQVAPVLGSALGGPMAGAATAYLAEQLLGNPNAQEAEVAEFISSASPETLLKLKQLDKDFEVRMRKLDIDVFKLETQDRQSARELARVNMMPQVILSSLFTAGYCLVLFGMFNGTLSVDPGMKAEINIVLGVLTAGMVKILDFWFGSSYGSKEKTAQLVARS